MLEWSLLGGSSLTVVLVVLGAAGFLALVLRRGRAWWLWAVPVAAVLTAVSIFLVYGTLTWCGRGPTRCRRMVWAAIVGGVAAVWLALAQSVAAPRSWWRPPKNLVLAVVVVVACAELANVQFGQYPNVRDVLGSHRPTRWLPKEGGVAQVDIPGTVSHFAARPGLVYLPPACSRPPGPPAPRSNSSRCGSATNSDASSRTAPLPHLAARPHPLNTVTEPHTNPPLRRFVVTVVAGSEPKERRTLSQSCRDAVRPVVERTTRTSGVRRAGWPQADKAIPGPGLTGGERIVRITVDEERCCSAGQCVLAAPGVFDQRDDDGVVLVLEATPVPAQHSAVREAEQICPAAAIVVDEG